MAREVRAIARGVLLDGPLPVSVAHQRNRLGPDHVIGRKRPPARDGRDIRLGRKPHRAGRALAPSHHRPAARAPDRAPQLGETP